MRVVSTIDEVRACCAASRSSQQSLLGLVPTMGALHAGHLSLVAAARRQCDVVAVSIFVNPTQFGPGEDLDKYPRTFEADCALLEAAAVDLVFAPSASEMYPTGSLATFVDPGPLGNRLDGRSRPGHFRGVCTVVNKLFHIVAPDIAFFGQKDAAQVAVLRAMVRDLNQPVRLEVCPTMRDSDGLALSSRNRYLDREQRQTALALPEALHHAERMIDEGQRSSAVLLDAMQSRLEKSGIRVDYVEVIDTDTLLPIEQVTANTLLAIAAWVGETRLIDNVPVASAIVGGSR